MGMQRLIAAVVATTIGLQGLAAAQPTPAPTPAPTPTPAPAPAQSITGWWRFTLVDGQTVDAYVVSSDATSLVIQTPQGTYSLERARIAASSMLPGPSTAPPSPPAPQPYVPPPNRYAPPVYGPPPPVEDAREEHEMRNGLVGFAMFYGIAALIALVRLDDDDDARYGFIPIAGPMLWAATDDEKFFHDGWDWLATLSSISQLSIVAAFIKSDKKSAPKTGMTMTVLSTPGGGGGLSVMGSF